MAENHHPSLNRPVAGLLLALLVVGFYWKLVLSDQFTWLESSDLAQMYIPRFQFMANEWHHGRIPLWDPTLQMGQPLLAQSQPGVAYPLNWVLFSLPLSNGWVRQIFLHWYFVVVHLLAAFAAYRLARDLGCRRGAAILSGCVYSLSGWMAEIDWPDVLNGAVWAPLVLMHLLRAHRGADPIRAGVAGGFFLGLAWLAGHHQIPIYLCLAGAGIWACTIRSRRAMVGAALFFTAGFGLAAVQLLPSIEYARRAVRWVSLPDPVSFSGKIPFAGHEMFPFKAADLLGLVLPGWSSHAAVFVGATALLLAFVGGTQRSSRPLVAVSLGALLFSMSGYSLFHGIVYALVPLADKARNASHAILLFHVAVAALAAVGLQAILDGGLTGWLRRVRWAAAGFALLVLSCFAGIALLKGIAAVPDDRVIAVALAGLLAVAVLTAHQARQLSSRSANVLIVGLFLFEAGLVATNSWRGATAANRADPYTPHRTLGDVAEFLRRQPGYPRVHVESEAAPLNFGDFYGIPQSNGFVAMVSSNIYRQELHAAPALNLFGVAYSLRKEPSPVFRELAFTSTSGAKLYRNPDAFPRVWSVHEVLSMPGIPFTPFWVKDPKYNWRQAAFVVGPPPAVQQCGAPDRVDLTAYQSNRVTLHASMGCTGMVVLSDTMFPGWTATVDGRAGKVYEVYGSMRGIVVPAGAHEIVFRYVPTAVYIGASLSLLTLGLVVLFLRRGRS